MQKIAIVSYGLSDMMIPLAKSLADQVPDCRITLIFAYAQNKKKDGLIDFEAIAVENGFVPAGQIALLIGKEVMQYVAGAFDLQVFIYQDLKFKSWANLRLSFRLLQRLWGFDLIHINGTDATSLHLLPVLELKRWMKTVHDFHPHSGEGVSRGSMLLERFFLSRAPKIIIQNEADYHYMERHAPALHRKTSFIPFGYLDVYPAFLATAGKAEPAAEIDVLCFGRISQYKGLEYLLDALELLAQRGCTPKVVIGGSGSYDFGLARLPQMENVQFVNRYIANQELAGLIARSKIVVCPYTDATQSGVLMTAFAFHKPVIATAVGGFGEVIKNRINGFLVPPKAAAPLADAIQALLADPSLQAEMASNIQHRVGIEQYAWGAIARAYQAAYQQLR